MLDEATVWSCVCVVLCSFVQRRRRRRGAAAAATTAQGGEDDDEVGEEDEEGDEGGEDEEGEEFEEAEEEEEDPLARIERGMDIRFTQAPIRPFDRFRRGNGDEGEVSEGEGQDEEGEGGDGEGEEGEEEGEGDEEEEVCGVCGKVGELMLCDGCDVGVHPRCVGLARVPAGEWFCEMCQTEQRAPRFQLRPARQ